MTPLAFPLLTAVAMAAEPDPDLLLEACTDGDEQACTTLVDGGSRRLDLLERACHGGQGDACLSLAHAYADDASARDPDSARSWLQAACQAGHEPSCDGARAPHRPELEISREGVFLDGRAVARFAGQLPWTFNDGPAPGFIIEPLVEAMREIAPHRDLERPGVFEGEVELRVDHRAPSSILRRTLASASVAGWRNFHLGQLSDADGELVRIWLPALGSAQEQHPAIRAAAEARPGGAVLMGSLTTEEIKHGITGGMTQIFACWENTVRHQPDHQGGGVVVNFVIGSRGTVNSAVVATSELNLPDTEGCIARGFERLRFPSPRGGGIVRVSYPITFDRVDRPSP